MKKYIKFIVLFLIIIGTVIFIFKKYNSSFDEKPQVKYSELEDYLLENNDSLIYVTNNKNVSNVKEYFEEKNIQIVYMYLTKNELNKFRDKYGINTLPKIVYFKDGILSEYITYDKDTIEDFLNRNGFIQ